MLKSIVMQIGQVVNILGNLRVDSLSFSWVAQSIKEQGLKQLQLYLLENLSSLRWDPQQQKLYMCVVFFLKETSVVKYESGSIPIQVQESLWQAGLASLER